jgi:hypothetical protein
MEDTKKEDVVDNEPSTNRMKQVYICKAMNINEIAGGSKKVKEGIDGNRAPSHLIAKPSFKQTIFYN